MRKLDAAIMLAVISALLATLPISNVNAAETLVWSGSVYSSGAPVTSPILQSGIQYHIVANEMFWYNYPADLGADAMYYTDQPPHWVWTTFFPAPGGHSFLQINEMDVNWGPFSNGDTYHHYSIYYTGTGAAITFRLVDWIDGDFNNNYCHLPVLIYATDLPPPPVLESGHSPGYWKHQFNAYFEGKGKAQETLANLELYTGKINTYYSSAPPYFDGYTLPPVSSLDYNNDGTFGTDDAHYIFTDSAHNTLWLGLANWYNWASGYGPYY